MKPLSESRWFAWFCIILLGALVFVSTRAWAGGDEIKQVTHVENDISTVLTGGDNTATNTASISGSRSYGVGLGSIDVDIAQCLGSESTGIVVIQWQRLKENPWCMADTLDAKGLHEAAAKVRCSIDFYAKIFADNQECMALSRASIPVGHVEQPEAVEDNDEHDALYARLSALEADRLADAQRAEKAAQRANAAAERARKAETERKEYAQRIYEELQEWK